MKPSPHLLLQLNTHNEMNNPYFYWHRKAIKQKEGQDFEKKFIEMPMRRIRKFPGQQICKKLLLIHRGNIFRVANAITVINTHL